MKNLEQLQKEAGDTRKLLAEVTQLAEIEKEIAEGNLGLFVGHSIMLESKDGLAHLAIAYVNKKKAEFRALGIDPGPDLIYPDVTYTGASADGVTKVRFPLHTLPSFEGAVSVIRAHNGSWQMDKKGTLTINTAPRSNSFAVVGGQVFLNQAEFEKAYFPRSGGSVEDVAQEVASRIKIQLTENGLSYAAGIHLGDLSKEEIQWNKPEDLPPVGCDLLIKVPEGTRVLHVKTDRGSMGYDTEREQVFKVFRTGHLANRDGEMEYRLPDNSTVTGRFPWTYP